jgi:hypothetical protein
VSWCVRLVPRAQAAALSQLLHEAEARRALLEVHAVPAVVRLAHGPPTWLTAQASEILKRFEQAHGDDTDELSGESALVIRLAHEAVTREAMGRATSRIIITTTSRDHPADTAARVGHGGARAAAAPTDKRKAAAKPKTRRRSTARQAASPTRRAPSPRAAPKRPGTTRIQRLSKENTEETGAPRSAAALGARPRQTTPRGHGGTAA